MLSDEPELVACVDGCAEWVPSTGIESLLAEVDGFDDSDEG